MTCMPFWYRNDFEKTDGASALPRATRFDCCNCTPPKIPPIIPRRAADLTHTPAPGSISHHWLLQYRPRAHNPSCFSKERGGFSAHVILFFFFITFLIFIWTALNRNTLRYVQLSQERHTIQSANSLLSIFSYKNCRIVYYFFVNFCQFFLDFAQFLP